jgi:hypothetical protein
MGENLLSKRLGRAAVWLLDADAFQAALKAESRKHMEEGDSIRAAAGGLALYQMGTAAQQDSAGQLLSLLEAHVNEEHGDILPDFVAAEWLQELEEMTRADLATMKRSLCMLNKTDFNAYMKAVKGTKPKKPPGSRGGDSTEQVTLRLILSLAARGHSCKDAKTAQLARNLSHIFWRNTTKKTNDVQRANKLLTTNQAAAALGSV